MLIYVYYYIILRYLYNLFFICNVIDSSKENLDGHRKILVLKKKKTGWSLFFHLLVIVELKYAGSGMLSESVAAPIFQEWETDV